MLRFFFKKKIPKNFKKNFKKKFKKISKNFFFEKIATSPVRVFGPIFGLGRLRASHWDKGNLKGGKTRDGALKTFRRLQLRSLRRVTV